MDRAEGWVASGMIQATCPCCGQKVLKPDPAPRTKEQNIEFRKRWDAAYEKAMSWKRERPERWGRPE